MKVSALIVAAGKGERAGGDVPKQYSCIGGVSLIGHAVERLSAHPAVGRIVVVIGEGQRELLDTALAARPVDAVVTGGAARQESVRNGLEAIAAESDCQAVLIHDAARPFVSAEVIDRLVDALKTAKGAVPVLPVVDTLARDDGMLGDTVDRAGLMRVQTPQAFWLDAIMTSHNAWQGTVATDDAQMARAAGFAIATVAGDPLLDKITHPGDLARMEAMLAQNLIVRTGQGFDTHRLEAGQPLWLCGVQIPHSKGLAGHSDADVALHALTDALLGAIAAGDIGDHFPPSDPQWKGAASHRFVEHARELVSAAGGRIDHVDVTIICEAPKIGPYKPAMRAEIAQMLRVPPDWVSVKATTTERLGFTGRGEGIAAQAVATVSMRRPT